MSDRVFFIVDFQAKNSYTHHNYYVDLYSQFLKSKDFKFHVILPKYVEKSLEVKHANNYHYELYSNMYGALYSENILLFLISYAIEVLHKFFRKKIPIFIKDFITLLYATKLYLVIKRICRNFNYDTSEIKFDFIFPTSDPLSFRFMYFYYMRNENSRFYFRTVGAETRGSLANEHIFEKLGNQLRFSDRIRIGYEVPGYRDYLIENGIESNFLFLVPPPLRYLRKTFSENDFVRNPQFGFLGMAKRRKGFDLIPSIIETFNKNGIHANWIIQGTIFPWIGYEDTRRKILSCSELSGQNIRFLESDLDMNELQELIKNCSLVILPYDSESYSKNGSAIAYQCVESFVPIITKKGVGFAAEIDEFNLGISFEELIEIPKLVRNSNFTSRDFQSYIRFSHELNSLFLRI